MTASHRWTLSAGPRFRTPGADTLGGVSLVDAGTSRVTTVYVDTGDLRLLRWGCQLARTDAGWELTFGGGPVAPQHIEPVLRFPTRTASPPDAALELVTALTRGAGVRTVLRTRRETVRSLVVTPDGDTIADVVDDRTTVLEGRRITARFRDIAISGRDPLPEARAAVVEELVAEYAHAGATEADVVPAPVRVLGAGGLQPPDVAPPGLTRRASARDAIRHAIGASVSRLILHDASVRAGRDPEGVHQARVATRRLRSDLRTFRPLLDEAWTRTLRDDLHALGDVLGRVRDADVMLGRLAGTVVTLPERDRAAARPLLDALRAGRDAARAELLATLRSPAYIALLQQLVDAALNPRTLPDAAGPASTLLPPLAAAPWRRLRRRIRSLSETPSDAELHEVRILAKRARYAAEAVAPVARRDVAAFAKAVANLQDVLGEHHDAVVAEAWLRDSAGARTDRLVLGELLGLERARAAGARAEWVKLWLATRRAHPRSWA